MNRIAPLLLVNVVCSIAITVVNRSLFLGGVDAASLSLLHLVINSICLTVMRRFALWNEQPVPTHAFGVLALSFTASLVLWNENLARCGMFVYQASKIATLPLTAVVECALGMREASRALALSVTLLTAGWACVLLDQIESSGGTYAIAAASMLASIVTNVYLAHIVKTTRTSPLHLVAGYLPVSAILLTAALSVKNNRAWPDDVAATTALSCALALMLTMTAAYVTGRFSALTYQVIGLLKSLVTFTLAILVFGNDLTPLKSIGLSLCLVGLLAYFRGVSLSRQSRLFLFFCAMFLLGNGRDRSVSERRRPLGEPPSAFVILTFCSCDQYGCPLYEMPNRLKDLYCRLHGCRHVLVNDKHWTRDSNVSTAVTRTRSMWRLIFEIRDLMESQRHIEWILPMGGDQVLWNLSIPPSGLVPASAKGGARYDVIGIVSSHGIDGWGLRAPVILHNTETGREFMRRWCEYAKPNRYYAVEDQGVMNIEILRLLAKESGDMNVSSDVRDSYLTASACNISIPAPQIAIQTGKAAMTYTEYGAFLEQFSACVQRGLALFYGQLPYSTESPGARRVLLFHPGYSALEGKNWNDQSRASFVFARHFQGPRKSRRQMDAAVAETMRRFRPGERLDEPSASFSECVEDM